jgi:4-hydroxy-3-methylbut-2-enyl diphosphate reductase
MFQDKAYPWFVAGQRMASDDEAGEMAGGGGGPEEPGEASAGDAADQMAGGQEEPAREPGAAAEAAPAGAGQEPEGEPDAPAGRVADDQRAFEEALNAAMPETSVDYGRSFQSLREHDVVEGTVVHIDREGVLVDVGMKSEGIIRMNELTRDSFQNPEDVVSVGDRIKVYVLQTENSEGNLLLSKKRADFEVAWDRVTEAYQNGSTITAMVTDRVKGGLVVDLGIRGFVPASHVGTGRVKNLDKYVGQSIPLKVIEVDRERRKVVLSHKLAVDEEREKKRTETIETLAEGQERTGIVRRITDYGAFVDLGGIDGLLHISEMSWTRINHPSEVVKVGQKIQVVVQKMNLESGRVSLSMRQILPDPWKNVGARYKVGDVIRCKISRLVPFGAFVLLEEGVEAIIPNQELTYRRIKRPEQVVSIGDEVEARVLDVRPEERRMTLSIRAVQQEREAEAQTQAAPSERRHSAPAREAPRTTVADLLGEDFAQQREEFEREMKVKSKSRKKARDRAMEEAEEEAFGDLTDEELLDLAVEPGAGAEAGLDEGPGAEEAAGDEPPAGDAEEEEQGS